MVPRLTIASRSSIWRSKFKGRPATLAWDVALSGGTAGAYAKAGPGTVVMAAARNPRIPRMRFRKPARKCIYQTPCDSCGDMRLANADGGVPVVDGLSFYGLVPRSSGANGFAGDNDLDPSVLLPAYGRIIAGYWIGGAPSPRSPRGVSTVCSTAFS